MNKEIKVVCGIGITGAVVGGLFLLKKLNERLTRIQMALYDIADNTEEMSMTNDSMIIECINDNLDEIRNHTDDIASCIISINSTLNPPKLKKCVGHDPSDITPDFGEPVMEENPCLHD